MTSRQDLAAESSLCVWYPKIKGKISTPKTVIIPIKWPEILDILDGSPLDSDLIETLKAAGREIGYPLFLRSDQGSGKHEWVDTCYVPDEASLLSHVFHLIEWHECVGFLGLQFDALVLREFLTLESTFTAFAGMPVAKERRFFAKDGKVLCWHCYWPEDAIVGRNLPEDWKVRLATLNSSEPWEIALLSKMAELFGRANPGYWSVDFAKCEDGRWMLIDAARGEISWHPEDCPVKQEEANE